MNDTATEVATPRKHTRFEWCPAHQWIDGETRQRRAEYACEGGPTTPCTPGTRCHVFAGTDLFCAEVCHGEYELNWPHLTVSPRVNVTFYEGFGDRIAEWVSHLDETIAHCDDRPEDYADLAQRRLVALTEARSLVNALKRVTMTSRHDGEEMHVSPDGDGLFWRYTSSGYHGGVVPHTNAGTTTYGIHT